MPTPSRVILERLLKVTNKELKSEQDAFKQSADPSAFDQTRLFLWLDIQSKLNQLDSDINIISHAQSISSLFKDPEWGEEVIEHSPEKIMTAMINNYQTDIRLEAEKLQHGDDPSQFDFEPTQYFQAQIDKVKTIALDQSLIYQAQQSCDNSDCDYDKVLGSSWESTL